MVVELFEDFFCIPEVVDLKGRLSHLRLIVQGFISSNFFINLYKFIYLFVIIKKKYSFNFFFFFLGGGYRV